MAMEWKQHGQKSWTTSDRLGWIEYRDGVFAMWSRPSTLTGYIQLKRANGRPDYRVRLLDAQIEVERKLALLGHREVA